MDENKKVWLPPGVYSHWCHLFPNITSPPSEFYALLEKALEQRRIPKIDISRVYHKEGGLLSAKREYLRMRFDRLVFDVCGAPFGEGFFVSSWFTELPLINPLAILASIVGAVALFIIFVQVFGFWLGSLLLALGIIFLCWHMRAAIGNFLADLDSSILKLPWIGSLYRTFFRRITYYRIDTTLMYQEAIHAAVMQAVDDFTRAQGLKPLTEMERKPILKHLYRN
jgi:hypothetical protein